MKVLVPKAYKGSLPKIDDAEIVIIDGSQPVADEHLDAEVLVAWGQPNEVLKDSAQRLTRLRLVQAFLAGPDPVVAAGFDPEVPIASGVGLHDGPVAEHALGMILALLRNFPLAVQNAVRHVWAVGHDGAMKLRANDGRVTTLAGANVTIWGYGSIGSTLAPLVRALGADVTGVARTAGERDGVRVVDDSGLADVLAETDVLVMILPNHPSTANAMDAERFAQLKEGFRCPISGPPGNSGLGRSDPVNHRVNRMGPTPTALPACHRACPTRSIPSRSRSTPSPWVTARPRPPRRRDRQA